MIQVYWMCGPKKCLVGRLALKSRQIFFEYNADFIQTGIEISPFKLPLKSGVQVGDLLCFDGLFGVFNDSLPDGWGRLLLDRKLRSLGMNPGDLSPLDRLQYVGGRGMGALIYEPEVQGIIKVPAHQSLDEIAEEAYAFQDTEDDQFIDDLLAMNGSSAGARPKVVISIDKKEWIVKFRSSIDFKDIGPIEYAYHLMAKAAGLDVPRAKLFKAKKGPGYFGVQRFDRQDGRRVHMHTVSGLIHVDHRLPNLDYETIMKVTAWLTKDVNASEKQFRAAVFNVLAHNRDDHAKNFSFLMDEDGRWFVSPAYDLTFSSGPSGEHCTMVMGEGKHPTLKHLLELAEVGGIKKQKAVEIMDEVQHAVSQWKYFAEEAAVSQVSFKMIKKSIGLL